MPTGDAGNGHPRVANAASAALKPKRQRNRRGQGSRLRAETIAGAAALLERTGSEEWITLRAVAREVGIAAPSMAPRFADRAEIIDAVVAQELRCLHARLRAAVAAEGDPVTQLFAAARAYPAYGYAQPNCYRVIFERRFLALWDRENVGCNRPRR